MNPKTAITILLLILVLSVLTVLMIVINRGPIDDVDVVDKITETSNKEQIVVEEPIIEKTDLQKEIENKNYSSYEYPEIEKQKDEARLRLERLNELRGGEPGPTQEDLNAMSAEERAQLEAEARERLDRLNKLRERTSQENE